MRLFVAVRPSVAAAGAIGDAAAGMRRRAIERGVAARWAAPAGYHVTLAFLGWTRPEAVAAVRDAVGRAVEGARGVSLRTGDLGGFPDLERAGVLWLGVDDAGGRLTELAGRVGKACAELGFREGARRFRPHLTLCRCEPPSDLGWLAADVPENLRSESLISTVELLDSSEIHGDSGYRVVSRWAVGGGLKPVSRQTRPVERGPDDTQPSARTGGPSAPFRGPQESDHGDQGHRGGERG